VGSQERWKIVGGVRNSLHIGRSFLVNGISDVALEYSKMRDEQLLQIAGEGGLVDEAKLALQVEMERRNLTAKMVDDYRSEQLRYESGRKWKDPNVRSFYIFRTGFRVFGRAYLSDEDNANGIAVRTKWFVAMGIPIFPVASYRYCQKEVTTGMIDWTEMKLIGRVSLNWRQASRTWLVGMGSIVLISGMFVALLWWADRSHR
jgi:hypothetical protein